MSQHTEEHATFSDEANRRVKILTAISRTLDTSKIKHQGTREQAVLAIVAKLEATHNLRVADRGWLVVTDRAGKPCDLQKLVDDCLLLDKNLGDALSIAEAVRAGAIELGAKDELTTVQQKVQFISTYGSDAWEKLPAHRPAPLSAASKEMTRAEYMAMSMRDRINFQKTLTEEELGKILTRR